MCGGLQLSFYRKYRDQKTMLNDIIKIQNPDCRKVLLGNRGRHPVVIRK